MSTTPEAGPDDAVDNRPGRPLALTREVERPGGDRGRATGLALLCSTAGLAMGFALAGSMFAAMTPSMSVEQGRAGWSACPRATRPAEPMLLGVRLNTARGAPPVLLDVYPDTPAARAGLRPGDRVDRVDGDLARTGAELRTLLFTHRPGDVVDLEVRGRDGGFRHVQGVRLEAMAR